MSAPPLSRPGRGRLLLCVIAAHLLLGWWVGAALRPHRWADAPAATSGPMWLRLLPVPDEPPAAAHAEAPRTRMPQWRRSAPTVADPAQAPAIIASPAPQAITVAPDEVAAPAPPPAAAPLDLRLPPPAASQPRSLASLLRDDPRLRDRPLTATERIAQALDPTIREEAMPDGSRRFRRGNDCVVARPSRAGQLDPFDSTHPKPWLVGPC